MSTAEHHNNLFRMASSIIGHFKNSSEEYQVYLINNICENLIKYKNDKKDNNFKEMYAKYYLHGLTDRKDFEDLVKDGAFHLNEFDNCKNFFIECYEKNHYLVKKFRDVNALNAFSNGQAKIEYLEWLEENFKVYYDQYHKDPVN